MLNGVPEFRGVAFLETIVLNGLSTKALEPTEFTELPKTILVRLEQPEKVYESIRVTLLGISTEVKLEQYLKAEEPMLVTLLGISTEVKLEHS